MGPAWCGENLRLRLKYPIDDDFWQWLSSNGWRAMQQRNNRRRYIVVAEKTLIKLMKADLDLRNQIPDKMINAGPPDAARSTPPLNHEQPVPTGAGRDLPVKVATGKARQCEGLSPPRHSAAPERRTMALCPINRPEQTMARTIQQLLNLKGKTALVTGGSRGLGLQMAYALGEAGARIMLSSRKAEDLEQSAADLQAAGIDARWVAADCTKEADIAHLVSETLQRMGDVDILLNNAGAAWGA